MGASGDARVLRNSNRSSLRSGRDVGLNRTAICDVAVNGRMIVRDGRHALHEDALSRYGHSYERIWRGAQG
jgi:hypothetical protein